MPRSSLKMYWPSLWHTAHTEARRQQAEREGSLAALVCNPDWRLARDRAPRTPAR
jgi:hypothetical protein